MSIESGQSRWSVPLVDTSQMRFSCTASVIHQSKPLPFELIALRRFNLLARTRQSDQLGQRPRVLLTPLN
jgi:hypothetical protein